MRPLSQHCLVESRKCIFLMFGTRNFLLTKEGADYAPEAFDNVGKTASWHHYILDWASMISKSYRHESLW